MIFDNLQTLEFTDKKRPKYAQLADQVKYWINRKQIPPGTKLPGNRELAKFFDVAPVTINRSLQELTSKGILRRKVGSGTYIAARDKKANKLMRIGILCHILINQEDYYSSTVLNVLHYFWRNYKSDLITLMKSNKSCRELIEEYAFDGIVVLYPQNEFEPEMLALRNENYPVVSIGTKFPALAGYSFGTNHTQTAHEAVNFLAKNGHRNIGFISPDVPGIALQQRLAGYQEGMWVNRLPINPEWIIKSHLTFDAFSEKKLKNILDPLCPVSAFLMASHMQIVSFYSLVSKLGYKIPDDISLVAFDDPPYASQLNPPLTVYAQPIEQFTRKAAESLYLQITGGNFSANEECKPFLIERESVMDISGK